MDIETYVTSRACFTDGADAAVAEVIGEVHASSAFSASAIIALFSSELAAQTRKAAGTGAPESLLGRRGHTRTLVQTRLVSANGVVSDADDIQGIATDANRLTADQNTANTT